MLLYVAVSTSTFGPLAIPLDWEPIGRYDELSSPACKLLPRSCRMFAPEAAPAARRGTISAATYGVDIYLDRERMVEKEVETCSPVGSLLGVFACALRNAASFYVNGI